MIHKTVLLLGIALIAAVFAFSGIATGAAGVAKTLFVVFLFSALVTALIHSRNRINYMCEIFELRN